MAGGKGKGKKGKDKNKRNEKKRIEHFEPRSLPDDAITEILLRFPVKSVLRFRCVSKVWCAKIDSPEFKKKHQSYQLIRCDDEFLVVNRQYIMMTDSFGCRMNYLSCYDDYKSLSDLKSSCDLDINSIYFSSFSYQINGIVCVLRDPGWNVCLCNPALREIRLFPTFPHFPVRLGISCPYQDSAIGIGFDDAADDYVVVRFVHDGGDSYAYDLKCVSYHVKTESWTMIEMPTALVSTYAPTLKKRYASFTKLYASFFSHGCIHWCMDWCHMILTLNMNTNLFQEIQFPRGWKDYCYNYCYYDHAYLFKVDSSSIALVGTRRDDLHIWVMKQYGVTESWTKQYIISAYTTPGLPHILRPLSFWRKDKLFLLTPSGELICYDLVQGQVYEAPRRGQCDPMSQPHPNMRTLELVTCSGSLVSVYQS